MLDELQIQALKETLKSIEKNDTNYGPRYKRVLQAMALAVQVGLDAGFRIDPLEPDWPVAFITLPTGQVSWHIPAYEQEYDGHTTAEKYERIGAYVKAE